MGERPKRGGAKFLSEELARKRGNESEQKFRTMSKMHPLVEKITDGTHDEDVVFGIDFWCEFKSEAHLPDLPVQVKSSPTGVEEFKKDERFAKREDLLIVLNCGPRVSLKDFYGQFDAEIERIRQILKTRNVHFV